MKVFILVSQAGHYHGVYVTRDEAAQAALDKELFGFNILVDTV